MRARPCFLLMVFGVVWAGGWPDHCYVSYAAGPTQRDRLKSQTLVEEALQHEALGLDQERARLLSEAEQLTSQAPAVHWAQGKVLYRQQWVDALELPALVQQQASYTKYREIRDDYDDTVEAQFALATWCQKRDLPLQARAHLHRVIDLQPQHAAAREALGFVQAGNMWLSPEELRWLANEEQVRAIGLERWATTIEEIRQDLRSEVSGERKAAAARLAKINDPSAAPAIEALLCPESLPIAQLAVEALSKLHARDSTRALARQAIFSPWPQTQAAATVALKERPWEHFVPMLLDSLFTPTELQTRFFRAPGDRVVQQHLFAREGQTQGQVLTVNTAYKRVRLPFSDVRETSQRAQMTALGQEVATNQQLLMLNLETVELNNRIMQTLGATTIQQPFNSPEIWWTWWNQHNDVFTEGEKELVTSIVNREVKIVDRPNPPQRQQEKPSSSSEKPNDSNTPQRPNTPAESPPLTDAQKSMVNLGLVPPGIDPSRMTGRSDCLAAGTPVWTLTGKVAIERVRVGDLVLSKNIETGELAYKPVLKTTIRPAGNLIQIEAGLCEKLQTSGGHPFWISGQGWVKARDLQSGMLLHTPNKTVTVSHLREGSHAKTYNLIVADFHTYFASESRLLSHDNTVPHPTDVIVPGLVAQRSER